VVFEMNAVDLIVKKRDGETLAEEEIRAFVEGFVRGDIPDYQAAAFAMAVYFQGMDAAETTALTMAMAESGDQLDLHDAVEPGLIIVDKHSSGGVGDKTTLAVGPIVAACGLPVGKMSGRGLSFSGGTIDKLESIAGWSADLNEAQFRRQLGKIGLVVAGQTADLAPADKQLYALRDVTGTVPSRPLIAASIMSKKLAAGADAIVLDVKCGRGAFMETLEEARALAQLMVEIGVRAGRRMTALITQMEQPLGNAIGNALEVKEAIATLHGQGPADFQELVEAVSVEMLRLGYTGDGALSDVTAHEQIRAAIASGEALATFRAFVQAQGGDPAMVDNPTLLPAAPVCHALTASRPAFVHAIDARELGLTAVELGGGRHKKDDAIDHRVGIVLARKVGASIAAGETLATVHAADEEAARVAVARVEKAFTLGEAAVEPLPIILDRISSQ
jgi:pyrimidine-nucleoside phosphorylase